MTYFFKIKDEETYKLVYEKVKELGYDWRFEFKKRNVYRLVDLKYLYLYSTNGNLGHNPRYYAGSKNQLYKYCSIADLFFNNIPKYDKKDDI